MFFSALSMMAGFESLKPYTFCVGKYMHIEAENIIQSSHAFKFSLVLRRGGEILSSYLYHCLENHSDLRAVSTLYEAEGN